MRHEDMLKVLLIEDFPILTSCSRTDGHFQDGKRLSLMAWLKIDQHLESISLSLPNKWYEFG